MEILSVWGGEWGESPETVWRGEVTPGGGAPLQPHLPHPKAVGALPQPIPTGVSKLCLDLSPFFWSQGTLQTRGPPSTSYAGPKLPTACPAPILPFIYPAGCLGAPSRAVYLRPASGDRDRTLGPARAWDQMRATRSGGGAGVWNTAWQGHTWQGGMGGGGGTAGQRSGQINARQYLPPSPSPPPDRLERCPPRPH